MAAALATHNVLIPVDTQNIGGLEQSLQLNSAPTLIDDTGRIPVKFVSGSTIFMRDVADVCALSVGRDVQTNIGKRPPNTSCAVRRVPTYTAAAR